MITSPAVAGLRRRLGTFARGLGWRPKRRVAYEYFASAVSFATSGQHENAILALSQSLKIRPDYPEALSTLIQVLAHVGRYEEALDACTRALEADAASDLVSASLMQLLPTAAGLADQDRVRSLLHRCFANYTRLLESGRASPSAVSSMGGLLRLVAKLQNSPAILSDLDRCIAAKPRHTVFHLAKIDILVDNRRFRDAHEACRRVIEIDPLCVRAEQTIWQLKGDPAARDELRGLPEVLVPEVLRDYNNLLSHNIVQQLLAVMRRFYRELGVDAEDVPLVRRLARLCEKASSTIVDAGRVEAAPLQLRFEMAWRLRAERREAEALHLFEGIFLDPAGRDAQVLASDPHIKEAVVRSGEIVARHLDRIGNSAAAIPIYRDILGLHPSGVVARRLAVLLTRTGALREAARVSTVALAGGVNLFPRLPQTYADRIHADIRAAGEEPLRDRGGESRS